MTRRKKHDFFTAALLIIGNEILSGRTQDTNTPWIAERLTARGIVLNEVRVIPDNAAEIAGAVNALRKKYDYVFTTGGIGPTHDDITTESVARAFRVKLARNREAVRALEDHYGAKGLTAPRLKMAMIPKGAALIPNPVTAAPGFTLGNVHVMAGVPRIMQAMLDHVLGTLKAGSPILSNTISCTLAESAIAAELGSLAEKYKDVQIGSYPHFRGGALGLSLVLRSIKPASLQKATDDVIRLIKKHGDEPRAISLRSKNETGGA